MVFFIFKCFIYRFGAEDANGCLIPPSPFIIFNSCQMWYK